MPECRLALLRRYCSDKCRLFRRATLLIKTCHQECPELPKNVKNYYEVKRLAFRFPLKIIRLFRHHRPQDQNLRVRRG